MTARIPESVPPVWTIAINAVPPRDLSDEDDAEDEDEDEDEDAESDDDCRARGR